MRASESLSMSGHPDPESVRTGRNLSGCAIFLSIFVVLFLPCICGYLPPLGLTVSVPAATLAWYAYFKAPTTGILRRIAALFIPLVCSAILIKNIADTLWFGHGAWLR